MSCEETDFIPTRAKVSVERDFKVVEFQSYKSKRQIEIHDSKESKEPLNDTKNVDLNMKKARYEIIKFSVNGLTGVSKDNAKEQLAIRLGAKPRKNKARNYKEILEEKKKIKTMNTQTAAFQQLGKNSVGKSTAKGKSFDRKRKKEKSDILDIYGTVKKTELPNVKSNKRKK